jgi:hypothetical protein
MKDPPGTGRYFVVLLSLAGPGRVINELFLVRT